MKYSETVWQYSLRRAKQIPRVNPALPATAVAVPARVPPVRSAQKPAGSVPGRLMLARRSAGCRLVPLRAFIKQEHQGQERYNR